MKLDADSSIKEEAAPDIPLKLSYNTEVIPRYEEVEEKKCLSLGTPSSLS